MNRTTPRIRLATAALLAPLALGLVACGGDDDADDTQTSTSSGVSDQDGTSDEGGTTDQDDTTTLEGDVETAAETALGEVDGTVLSVDGDAEGWDVTVVTSDGSEHEVVLAADATSVTRTRVEDAEDDPDDAAERERLLGVSVDHLAAMEAARGEAQGTVTGVDLSEDDGSATWEVTFDEETPDETTVEVDAETGEVLRTERGD